jgi:hypothetical protein
MYHVSRKVMAEITRQLSYKTFAKCRGIFFLVMLSRVFLLVRQDWKPKSKSKRKQLLRMDGWMDGWIVATNNTCKMYHCFWKNVRRNHKAIGIQNLPKM